MSPQLKVGGDLKRERGKDHGYRTKQQKRLSMCLFFSEKKNQAQNKIPDPTLSENKKDPCIVIARHFRSIR